MNDTVTANENGATNIAAGCGRTSGQMLPKTWFAQLVQDLWPIKGAVAVAEYAQCPDRTARNYQGGHSEPPASILRDLLRGNEGYRVLTWIMAATPPAWWLNVQSELRVAKAYRDVKPKLREIFDGIEA